jgi:ADP-ribose pyrophosphatase YjhB (NUDIX family)
MVTQRKFTHFMKDVVPPRMGEIPEGGFCISTFVILSRTGSPNHVLMGHINRNAAWDHLGALDSERVGRHSKGWMLPSSALILGESPSDASKRILSEQLGLSDQKLDGPLIFSEVYGPMNHWDLEFIFLGEREQVPVHAAWRDLQFVDLSTIRKTEIARFHEDILAHVHRWNPQ